jgi:hypothetical protein
VVRTFRRSGKETNGARTATPRPRRPATDFAPLVIENKVFSLPDEAQLEKYANESVPTDAENAKLVLLSFLDPGSTVTRGSLDRESRPQVQEASRSALSANTSRAYV